jgi:hypothetical protein
MAPSRPLRRLFAALTTLALTLPLGGVTAHADGGMRARHDLTAGDRGSGPPVVLPAAPRLTTDVKWSDVPKSYWAKTAIDYVGGTESWMRDFKQNADGTYLFKPDSLESRKLFARTVVRAFAPDEPTDPDVTFPDLPDTDRSFAFANIAVKLGWLTADADGNFLPDDPVTTRMVHRALVLALGLGANANGLDRLHMRNGTTFDTPRDFGTLLIGMRLGLRYNHSDESLDVGPDTSLPRAEVAWSLYRAATVQSWQLDAMAPYATIRLPNLKPEATKIVRFGVQYVGYPYVYGGEWYEATPPGYCCGAQPVGGFDCSGITWWVVKEATGGWDNVPPRDYRGWPLPQRSSADMASTGTKVRRFEDLRAGDLMFYDGDGNGVVDHVDVYIGNGWSIDSSSSMGGVSIVKVNSGWYFDHFVHGRRVIGTTS